MDCKEFREVLDLYVDRELSLESMSAGQSHLKGCAACGRVERQLVLLRNSVKRVVNEFDPPAELTDKIDTFARPSWLRLLTGLRKGSRLAWHKKVAVPMPAFAMFLIAVLSLGVWVMSRRTATTPPGRPPGVRTVTPMPESRGLDLSRFDRGERAAIEKMRLRNR
ncbi:MAG: zf-HC2 domain-containing protein [bacterium]